MTDLLHETRTSLSTTLTVRLQMVSANSGRPLHGCAVRLRPCDDLACDERARADGTAELRISDRDGWTEFDEVLPASGPGRWPHLHFDIDGRAGRLALPGDCFPAYASSALAAGEPLLIPSVTGDGRRGLVATRTMAVGPVFTPGRG